MDYDNDNDNDNIDANGSSNSANNGIPIRNGRGDPSARAAAAANASVSKGCSFYKDVPETVVASMVSEKDSWYYNMNHKNRGIALIFNHENFSDPKLKARSGTKTDCANLESTLRSLRFDVYSYFDATYSKIKSVINDVAKMDHSDNDCFVLSVLSHGELNIIHAYDNPYQPETLWHSFTADKCPSLAGKPKIFFIQACRGDRLDPGVTLMKRTETDAGPISYRIPVHADFLIAYSTIPGFYSWRNTQKGSWFMQALCEELKKHCYSLDLLTILTFVNRRVATDYQSNVPGNTEMDSQKQIPCISFMLTRLLKFEPKC